MKICFFSPASYPFFSDSNEHTSGGAEFQIYLLAKTISENKGFEISFVVGDYSQQESENIQNVSIYKGFNIRAGDSVFRKIKNTFKYRSLLKKIKPDLVVTTTANSITGITALFKKRLKFKHLHRTAHLNDVNKSWIRKNGIAGKIYKFGLERADRIITQSKEHKELLFKNHGINAEIIRNVFEIKEFKSPEKKGILWVGRFECWKNPGLYLELVKDNPSVKFTMICPYAKHHKKQWNLLKNEASKLKNLNFIEKVPFHKIQHYFDHAQIFVNTSSNEGFPNTFLQAAQAKTPILSLNVDPDNFIKNYKCGFYFADDFNLMKSKFKKIIDNPSDLNRMGNNNYEYLKTYHDIQIIIKEFESIILTLQDES